MSCRYCGAKFAHRPNENVRTNVLRYHLFAEHPEIEAELDKAKKKIAAVKKRSTNMIGDSETEENERQIRVKMILKQMGLDNSSSDDCFDELSSKHPSADEDLSKLSPQHKLSYLSFVADDENGQQNQSTLALSKRIGPKRERHSAGSDRRSAASIKIADNVQNEMVKKEANFKSEGKGKGIAADKTPSSSSDSDFTAKKLFLSQVYEDRKRKKSVFDQHNLKNDDPIPKNTNSGSSEQSSPLPVTNYCDDVDFEFSSEERDELREQEENENGDKEAAVEVESSKIYEIFIPIGV